MLTDKQEEIIGDALRPLFEYLEQTVIMDVASRIQETMMYSRTAEIEAQKLQQLGFSPARIRKEAMKVLKADPKYRKAVAKNTLEHKRKVKKLLREIMKEAGRGSRTILKDSGDLSWLDDLHTWKEGGKELTDRSYLPQIVEAIRQQTDDTMRNLTGTTGFKTMAGFEPMESLYQRELDKAIIKVCTGTYSRDQVVYDTIHHLAESGLRTIDYATGYSMQLDTAVKLAVRTSAHQLSAKIMDANIAQTKENLVYVSKHWGARNTGTGHANHEKWQGMVYFIKEGTNYAAEAHRIGQDRITSLWYATGYSADGTQENDPLGLHGYNCRHRHYVWFQCVSELPREDPEPSPVTIDGKTYDYYRITQKMRSMERSIRALKREREALASLNMDYKETSTKIKQKLKAYKDFCDQCKVKPALNRCRYEGRTSDLTKTKAWKEYEKEISANGMGTGKATTQPSDYTKLKLQNLSAFEGEGDSSQPVSIGQIDADKTEEAMEFFGNEIRDSETEKLIVIDKAGNVYYNTGEEDAVSFGDLDLTGCSVLHNHPENNGIVSFGKDDFLAMRDTEAKDWYLVNKEYNYYARKLKPMDQLSYDSYYRKALSEKVDMNDIHDDIFNILKKEEYIEYVRKAINTSTKTEES